MRGFFQKPGETGLVAVALLALIAAFAYVSGAFAPVKASSCEADLWRCDAWGACSVGYRNRICVMTYDCPSAVTPKPPSRESCRLEAGCAEPTWECGDWQPCAADGTQARACKKVAECSGHTLVRPETERACPTVQCPTAPLAERVRCELRLTPEGAAHERQLRASAAPAPAPAADDQAAIDLFTMREWIARTEAAYRLMPDEALVTALVTMRQAEADQDVSVASAAWETVAAMVGESF